MSTNPESQYTFFGEHQALAALSQAGDRLEELERHVDFAPLVKVAEQIWRPKGERQGAGRPRWSSEVMLRVLLLKRLYNLSDEQTEYQLRDRLSFLRFAGLGLGDKVPDSRTIWLYGEELKQADGARGLFEALNAQLQQRGLMVQSGVLVDATLVAVPKQRNTREENAQIKAGETPADWLKQPRKLAQKDVEARWTKRYHQTYYGYKNHVKTSVRTKLILDYTVTAATVQDGTQLPALIQAGDRSVHADRAYAGRPNAAHLRAAGVENLIHEKAEWNRTLTDEQKQCNRTKSTVRARVEHPFAFMQRSLGGLHQRCIGFARNAHQIGLLNLAYNLCRGAYLLRAAS